MVIALTYVDLAIRRHRGVCHRCYERHQSKLLDEQTIRQQWTAVPASQLLSMHSNHTKVPAMQVRVDINQ